MFSELRPHLVELRKRLGLSVLSVFIAFIVAFTFHEAILAWVTAPLNIALEQVAEISKKAAEGMVTTHQVGGAFFVALKVSFFAALLGSITVSYYNRTMVGYYDTDMFSVLLQFAIFYSFFAALLGALPYILYQIWLFVAPGLYSNEKKMVLPFVIGGTVMFAVGVLFAYYVVTPFGFQFLITFGSFLYTPLINIEDYVGFFTKIMMGFGIAFELPVFAYFLALLGLVTDKTLKDFFKYAVVLIFILAALLTPPDVLTQLLMAAPLVLLYGVSILIVRMVNPHIEDEDDEETSQESEASQND